MTPEIFYVIGALMVGVGLAFGLWRGRLKSPTARAISEEATREQYDDPERYDETRQEELAKAADAAEKRARDT